MPSAVCTECSAIVKIRPTGETKRAGYTAEWWEIENHPDERETVHHGPFSVEKRCDGSGRRV